VVSHVNSLALTTSPENERLARQRGGRRRVAATVRSSLGGGAVEVRAAFTELEAGYTAGKVVLTMNV